MQTKITKMKQAIRQSSLKGNARKWEMQRMGYLCGELMKCKSDVRMMLNRKIPPEIFTLFDDAENMQLLGRS